MNLTPKQQQIAVIAGVEIGFGIIEGLVIPNVLHRKKGEAWKIPSAKDAIETITTLTITGIISGYLADLMMEYYKIADTDKRRPYFIAGTAIGVNVIESIIVPNIVGKKLDKSYKFELPSGKVFAGSMLVLSLTAIAGGYTADTIIANLRKTQGGDTLASKQLAEN